MMNKKMMVLIIVLLSLTIIGGTVNSAGTIKITSVEPYHLGTYEYCWEYNKESGCAYVHNSLNREQAEEEIRQQINRQLNPPVIDNSIENPRLNVNEEFIK